MKKRFFFVSCAHNRGFGNWLFFTENWKFVENSACLRYFESKGVESVVILNVVELSEKEYEDFRK